MERRILHLDIDAFLASIEQIVEPSLKGKPVVVGSGVVASRSYEAKARGVQTAMAMSEARRRCPDLVVRDGDARLAERFRQKVAEVLRRFTPQVQICSLDDMYADLTGVPLPDGVAGSAARIRAAVCEATGLSVSQGIASTKSVARMATTHAKPGGILEIPAGAEREFLAPHALRDLPGIGAATARLLEDLNLRTVGDLWVADRELLRRTFGARGDEIWLRARGLDEATVEASPAVLSISRETSFEAVADRELLLGMLAYLVDRAATELRAQGLRARSVQVRLRHIDQETRAIGKSLKRASDGGELFELAFALLDRLLERRVLVRLIGVTLANFQHVRSGDGRSGDVRSGDVRSGDVPLRAGGAHQQGELFMTRPLQQSKLLRAVDAVRARHGFGKLIFGRATGLLGQVPNTTNGFRLRTPSLTK